MLPSLGTRTLSVSIGDSALSLSPALLWARDLSSSVRASITCAVLRAEPWNCSEFFGHSEKCTQALGGSGPCYSGAEALLPHCPGVGTQGQPGRG